MPCGHPLGKNVYWECFARVHIDFVDNYKRPSSISFKDIAKKQIWGSKPPFGVMLGVKNGTVGFPRYGFILVRLKCTASTVTNDQPTN